MDQREALWLPPLDLLERAKPALDVDIGRRGDGQYVAAGLDADAGGVAGVERSIGVQVADVVGGMAGRRETLEPDDPLADHLDVRLRHRRELAPEDVDCVAVEAAGAAFEAARVRPGRRPHP